MSTIWITALFIQKYHNFAVMVEKFSNYVGLYK